MAARKRRARDAVRTAGSWMALLAATTLGGDVAAESIHAEVRADGALKKGESFRLIVQTYDAHHASDVKSGRAKPVGSIQRVVSSEELKHGIRVDFVELRAGERDPNDGKGSLVVAWLETTQQAHYELDAREARPRPGSVYGVAHRDTADVKIRLDRTA